MKKETILKDDKLEEIKRAGGNIARFISISPELEERHVNIEGYKPEGDIRKDIVSLIKASKGKSVNIRSFSETSMKSSRFVYGKRLEDINEIMEILKENCSEGKYSIVNETIDVNDGGVSGVLLNNIIEFAPNDTPRCVEKPGSCRMERGMGLHMLETVYGFYPATDMPQNYRTEFSLHPSREGLLGENTVVWEFEEEISKEASVALKAEMERLRAFAPLLGNVSIEWVYDGKQIWIVQLNQIRDASDGHTIVKGKASRYEKFDVLLGLEALREKIRDIEKGTGIELVGEVGISSHFGDLLRQAQVPSFIKRKK